MKRVVTIFLLLVLMCTCLVACKSDEETSDATSSGNQNVTDEYLDADGNYVPRHEVKDMQGKKFTIIVRGPVFGTYQSDDFTTESELYGELIDEAVQRRNDTVERLYNVELDVIKSDTIYNDILLDCQSSLGSFDAIMPSLSDLSNLAFEGYL